MVSNYQGTSEVLRRVLASARGHARLDRDREACLARRARAGDPDAASELVLANLGRLTALARSHRRLGLGMEDLVHEGAVGLLEAVRHFDPDRDVRFFTYAAFFVRRTIVAGVARSCKTVRLPRQVAARIRLDRERLPAPAGRTDGPDLTPVRRSTFEISLDAPAPGRRQSRWQSLAAADGADPVTELLAREAVDELDLALASLPNRDRVVLARRFGLGGGPSRTLRQVGAELQLSKERVRQIEDRALATVRRIMEARRCPRPAMAASAGR